PWPVCGFDVYSEEWRSTHWHGCGLPLAEHEAVPFGSRWVAHVPPVASFPCFVTDLGPPPPLTREQIREEAQRRLEARKRPETETTRADVPEGSA
ncbi:MAG: hypothetical protein ACREC5_06540, partial [Thermoplasmata archaeon]